MCFIAISKDCSISGYETHLEKSEYIIHWEYFGPIFKRNDLNIWDSKQCAGYAAFHDMDFDGTGETHQINGAYYISYLAGNSDGYEPDPLYMGLAKSSDPTDPDGFTRFPKPILRPDGADSCELGKKMLYKSFLFEDKFNVTGYKYVNAYNVKSLEGTKEFSLPFQTMVKAGNATVTDLLLI